MKKIYECPDVEIKEFQLTECILSSIESAVSEQVTEFVDPINDPEL